MSHAPACGREREFIRARSAASPSRYSRRSCSSRIPADSSLCRTGVAGLTRASIPETLFFFFFFFFFLVLFNLAQGSTFFFPHQTGQGEGGTFTMHMKSTWSERSEGQMSYNLYSAG